MSMAVLCYILSAPVHPNINTEKRLSPEVAHFLPQNLYDGSSSPSLVDNRLRRASQAHVPQRKRVQVM